MFEIHLLKRIVEAALLASAQPLTLPQLSNLFDEFDMPSHDDLACALTQLQGDCAERGVELVEVASGFRYQVRQDVHAFVARLWSERPSRYSRALLETLSLIAYRQPITRAEIEQIRGVAVSTHIVRTLEEREWVRVVGYRDLPGKPELLGTTKQLLDYFNLKSLDQLPPLSEIRDIDEFDPQLAFGAVDAAIPAFVSTEAEAADADADAVAAEQEEQPDDASADTPEHAELSSASADDDAAPQLPSSTSEEPPTGAAHEDTPDTLA
jgi:segregation and condensation protein B